MRNDWDGDRFSEFSEQDFRKYPDAYGEKNSQALIALTNLAQARAGLQIRLDTAFQSGWPRGRGGVM